MPNPQITLLSSTLPATHPDLCRGLDSEAIKKTSIQQIIKIRGRSKKRSKWGQKEIPFVCLKPEITIIFHTHLQELKRTLFVAYIS